MGIRFEEWKRKKNILKWRFFVINLLKSLQIKILKITIEDLEINGRIFLDLKSDSDILEDLCLTKKEEKLLLECNLFLNI